MLSICLAKTRRLVLMLKSLFWFHQTIALSPKASVNHLDFHYQTQDGPVNVPCWPDFNPILVHYIFSTNSCHFLIKVLADGLVAYSRLLEVCFCPWFPLKACWSCPWCWRVANVRHWFCRHVSFIHITTEDQKYLYMIVWVIAICGSLNSGRVLGDQILISLDDM